jgi:hypothetical protein
MAHDSHFGEQPRHVVTYGKGFGHKPRNKGKHEGK